MTGYHRDADATRATLRDGCIATGDLGYLDEDGYVHFVSRIKDMLKPSGENVAAAEIQDALQAHPDVQEAAVFGIDDPIRVERVIAAVVREPDSKPTQDELRAHCGERLAAFKVPSEIVFVSEIPKTSIGKQQVGELKRRYRTAQDSR
jgi:acyl-coenzyme A synthetase/AMP-(fatty) acid ligase